MPKKSSYHAILGTRNEEETIREKMEFSSFSGQLVFIPEAVHRGWTAWCQIKLDSFENLDASFNTDYFESKQLSNNVLSVDFTYKYLFYDSMERIYLLDKIIKNRNEHFYTVLKPDGSLRIKIPIDPGSHLTSKRLNADTILIQRIANNSTGIIDEIRYNNNLRNGEAVFWYENHSTHLFRKCYYKNGYKDGFCETYYFNGNPESKGYYKSGIKTGKWLYYDLEGKLKN